MQASNARDRILQRICSALGRKQEQQTSDVESAFQRLLANRQADHNELTAIADPVTLFATQATAAGARVVELNSAEQVIPWLQATPMATAAIALSAQTDINSMDWSGLALTDNYHDQAATGVVKAQLAAAETGTLLLHSRAVPSGLLYLVETLIVLLDRADIKARYEDMWAAAEFTRSSKSGTPRAVHLISGPSRTADVEQTIQIGAHGPREVYILLLGEA